jgi:hypothetical protein
MSAKAPQQDQVAPEWEPAAPQSAPGRLGQEAVAERRGEPADPTGSACAQSMSERL